ncbi:PAS domain-containing protein [Mucilaginibacter psychrotolerans]|uniref:PAS domain S-box protein n=1 Tax=Mucilaginibacter psychrotolerans TaxID=1524096 RepID=A0A4Y8S456_9SPHI|nr:PAS domain S-box protein [Mucilaginibacter psychrotolerans]TFF33516.1 PAS domain S-box protein [Mucilaginibacter psychrotolerans]
MKFLCSYPNYLINRYKAGIRLIKQNPSVDEHQIFTYWQNKTFAILLVYIMPACIVVLVPSMILEFREGDHKVVILDVLAFVAVYITALSRQLSYSSRKIIIAAILTVFSFLLMIFMKSLAMGTIYFFALSIFLTLQFSNEMAYSWIITKTVLCLTFTGLFWGNIVSLSQYFNISFYRWVIYTSNFLLLDWIIIITIRQLLGGLEKATIKRAGLYDQLEMEISHKIKQNKLLTQSQAQYKMLFSSSPLPKFLIDKDSKRFKQVNQAAIDHYGYTEAEFLNMQQSDIECPGEMMVNELRHPGEAALFNTIHTTKGNNKIHVEVRSNELIFNDRNAILATTTDVTQSVKNIKAIKEQNEKLQKIAFLQSHVARVPVANIIGLTNLLIDSTSSETEQELIVYLRQSALQLDAVIRNIVKNTEEN